MHGFLTAKLPELATKAEVIQLGRTLRTGLADLRTELKTAAADLRAELKTGAADLRAETAELRTEIMRRPTRTPIDFRYFRRRRLDRRRSDNRSAFRSLISIGGGSDAYPALPDRRLRRRPVHRQSGGSVSARLLAARRCDAGDRRRKQSGGDGILCARRRGVAVALVYPHDRGRSVRPRHAGLGLRRLRSSSRPSSAASCSAPKRRAI